MFVAFVLFFAYLGFLWTTVAVVAIIAVAKRNWVDKIKQEAVQEYIVGLKDEPAAPTSTSKKEDCKCEGDDDGCDHEVTDNSEE